MQKQAKRNTKRLSVIKQAELRQTTATLVLKAAEETVHTLRLTCNDLSVDHDQRDNFHRWITDAEKDRDSLKDELAQLELHIAQLKEKTLLARLLKALKQVTTHTSRHWFKYLFCGSLITAVYGLPAIIDPFWLGFNCGKLVHSEQSIESAPWSTTQEEPSNPDVVTRLSKAVPDGNTLKEIGDKNAEYDAQLLISVLSDELSRNRKVEQRHFYSTWSEASIRLAIDAFKATGQYDVEVTPETAEGFEGCTIKISPK